MAYNGALRVAAKPCSECLFSKNRVVSERRAQEVIADCLEIEAHFVCHVFSIKGDEGELTADEANVCCNGFFREYPDASQFMQFSHRLNAVNWVDVDGNIIATGDKPHAE